MPANTTEFNNEQSTMLVFGFADIQHPAAFAEHPVNARLFGSDPDVLFQNFQSASDINQLGTAFLKN